METTNPANKIWSRQASAVEKRDIWSSLEAWVLRSLPARRRDKLFRALLKVADRCSVCGLDFTPHRADDLPAYLVIVIVGHIVVLQRF
jgi:uncharacterized protein (DUF983 family)